MSVCLVSLINVTQTIDGTALAPFQTQVREGDEITPQMWAAVGLRRAQAAVLPEAGEVRWANSEGTQVVGPDGDPTSLGGGSGAFTEATPRFQVEDSYNDEGPAIIAAAQASDDEEYLARVRAQSVPILPVHPGGRASSELKAYEYDAGGETPVETSAALALTIAAENQTEASLGLELYTDNVGGFVAYLRKSENATFEMSGFNADEATSAATLTVGGQAKSVALAIPVVVNGTAYWLPLFAD